MKTSSFQNERISPAFIALILLLLPMSSAFAGGWANLVSSPTGVYLGDTPQMPFLWVDNTAFGDPRNGMNVVARQGSQNLASTGGAVFTGAWLAANSGAGQSHRPFAPQANSTGVWYWGLMVEYQGGSPYKRYAVSSGWVNMSGSWNTGGVVMSYNVQALGDPTSLAANNPSLSQNPATRMDISWARWSGRDVMVVRSTSSNFTAPTQGSTYNSGNTIGSGTVIYRGSATSVNDTGLLPNTTYYYRFYSENFSYYSPGAQVSETTQMPRARNTGESATPQAPATIFLGDGGLTFGLDAWSTLESNWGRARLWLRFNNADVSGGTASDWTDYVNVNNRTRTSGTFNQVGTWYWAMEMGYGSPYGDGYWYKASSSSYAQMSPNGNGSSLSVTVSALNSPTSQDADPVATDQINLSWTRGNSGGDKDTLILRKTTAITTHPTQGTAYSVSDMIDGATVIYKGSGTSHNDTSLTQGTTYYYAFYSINNDYYSPAATASATTLVPRPTDATWDGGGANDNTLTEENWVGDLYPEPGAASIMRFAGSTRTTPNVNYTANSDFGSIYFNSGAAAFTVGGNALNIHSLIRNDSSNLQTINNNLTVSAATDVQAQTGNVALGGSLSGSAGLSKSGANALTLSGDNSSFSGGVTQNASGGTLNINHNNALGSAAYTIQSGNTFDNTSGGSRTIGNNVNVNAATTFGGSNPLVINGEFNLGSGNRTLTVSGSTLTINGQVTQSSGSRLLTKNGTGTLTLNGNNNHAGVTITAGSLNIGHANALGTGTFTPGANTYDNTSGGALTVANAVSWNGNSTFAGTDNLTISGNTTLNANRTLNVSANNLILSGILGETGGARVLTKGGAGTMTLSGNNTHSGGTSISGGQLNINHNNALGSGTFTTGSGTFDNTSGGSITAANDYSVTGNPTFVGSNPLTLSGTGTLTGNRIITVSANTLTLSGVVTETGGTRTLTKQGAGTLVLGQNNTYNGATTISAGTLQIGAGGTSGSVAANIVNNAALVFNRTDSFTYDGVISGSGTLTKEGAGTLTLGGNSSFSGNSFINAGAIRITHGSGLGNATGSNIVANGAAFEIIGGISSGERMGVSGTGLSAGGVIRSISGDNTLSGAIHMGANSSVGVDANTLTMSGIISGAHSLTKVGPGILSVSAANTFNGGLSVLNGTVLSTGNAASLGAGAVTVGDTSGSANVELAFSGSGRTHANNVTVASGSSGTAMISHSGNTSVSLSGTVTFNKAVTLSAVGGASSFLNFSGGLAGSGAITVDTDPGTINFSADNSSYTGPVNVDTGTLRLSNVSALSANNAVTMVAGSTIDVYFDNTIASLAGAGTVTANGSANRTLTVSPSAGSTTFSGAINDGSRVLSLTKAGAGTQILTGTSTHSGNTTVSAGTLVQNGTNTSSAVSVSSGATLMGGGSVAGLTVTGTVRPGNDASTIGRLNVSSLTMNNGSALRVKLGDVSNTANRDFINNSGSATISATTTVFIDDSVISNWDNTQSYSWNIIVGGISSAANFSLDETHFSSAKGGGTFDLSASGGNLVLTFTPAAGEPTVQATDITFSSVGVTSMTVSWTSGNGASRIVVARAGSAVNANPADSSSYSANAAFGSGAEIGTGNFVVYNGSGSSVAVTGLSADTIYHFRVYEYNGSGGTEDYLTSTATGNPASRTTLANQPTTQASSVTFSSLGSTSLGVSWTSGNGAGRLVIARQGSAPSGGPVDGTTYTADANFAGSGSALGSGKVVYIGTGNSFTLTGLSAQTEYFIQVFEYNGSGLAINYFNDTATGNPASRYTLSTEPGAHATAFTATPASTTSINLNWTAASGPPSGYIILQRTGADPTGTPSDGQGYSVGNGIGDGTVAAIVTPGSATSTTISGLSAGTTYHFSIMPFNWDGSSAQTYNYRTAATIPTANASTVFAEPGTQASAITFTSVGTSGMTVNWTSGNGANRIVVGRAGSAVNANPADQTAYSANAAFGSGAEIGTGNFVVYSGSGSSVAVTGLSPDTVYHFRVYEFNGSGNTANYNVNTASGNPASRTTMANEPTVNASSATITAITPTGFTVNWTAGNGANSIVLIKAAAAVDSNPVDQTTYTANSAFGSGSELGTGNFVVYKGAGTSVAVTGLSQDTVYHVAVYSYNGSVDGAENYLTTGPATSSASTLTAEPTTQATNLTFPSRTKSSIQVNWTSGNGANRIVVARQGSAVADLPVDGTGYTANAEYGSGDALGTGFVVYSGSGNSVTVTGLNTNTTYHFRVFEFNGSAATANYFTDTATGNPASHTTAANEPGIGINPATLTPSATVGNTPAAGSFVVTNVGGSSLSYSLSTNQSWLSISPNAGSSIGPAGTLSHTITYNATGLGAGTYDATITITGTGTGENAATNSPRTIPVTLTMNALPDPTAVSVTAESYQLMRLAWTKNASYDVMITYREGSAPAAPVQGTSYNVGDGLAGGGQVIYKGTGSAWEHEVTAGETHHYAFYSINNNHYSPGVSGSDSTPSFLAGDIFEPFGYTNNTFSSAGFDAKSGGIGWTSSWSLTTGGGAEWSIRSNTDTDSNRPMFFDAPSNQVAISGNRAFLSAMGADRWGIASRGIPEVTNGVIYVSALLAYRYEETFEQSRRWATIAILDGSTEHLEFGKVFGENRRFSIRRSGSNASSSTNIDPYQNSTNNWYWVVLKYDFAAQQARVKAFRRSENIPFTEPSSWDATWGSLSLGRINRIRLKAGSNEDWIGGALFDEIRVASTWTELIGQTITDPGLAVSPASVTLNVMLGSTSNVAVNVQNVGGSTLLYTNTITYGTGSGWATPTPGTSSLAPAANENVTLALNASGLTPATTYYATNTVAGNQSNANQQVSIAMTVTALPDPTAVTATADGPELVRLAFTPPSGYQVMVVYRQGSAPTGDPTQNTLYNVGDALGLGTVLYKGSASGLEHVVAANQTHFYRVYTLNNNHYSPGVQVSTTTPAFDSIVMEPFGYTNGVSLAGLNGGNGWSGAWSVGAGSFMIVSNQGSGSIPRFFNQPPYPDHSGNLVRFSNPGNGNQANATRSFDPVTSGYIYAAAVMSYQFLGTEKWFGLSLMSNATEKIFVGKLFDNADDREFGINGPNITKTKSGQNLSPWGGGSGNTGNVYLVILRYNFSTREIDALRYHRTQTVPDVEPGSWTVSVTAPIGDVNMVNGIRLSGGSSDPAGTIGEGFFDEIRVATTWADLFNQVGVVATNYQIGNATNYVFDAQVNQGTFPVVMTLRSETGVETVNTTPPFFIPNYDIFNPGGVEVVTDQVFTAFSFQDSGRTVIASNAAHSTVVPAQVLLGVYTGRWSAIASNGVAGINISVLSNNTPIVFTVVDDDTTPPEVVQISSTNTGGNVNRNMHIAIGNANLTANSAAGANISYTATDGQLASVGATNPLVIWLGARDAGSGLARGNTDPAINSHLTIGSAIFENVAQYDAFRSSTFAQTMDARATNVWSWITPMTPSEIGELFDTTTAEGSNAVIMTWRDADNDRPNDFETLITTQGWFRVIDDDPYPPLVQNFNIFGVGSGSYTVTVEQLIGGIQWSITGLVRDAESGINVNGTNTVHPDISPYFELWDPAGSMQLRQAFNDIPFANGGALSALTPIRSGTNSPLVSAPLGIWTARVVVADADNDRPNDRLFTTNAFTFTVIPGDSLAGIDVSTTLLVQTSSFGNVTGPTNFVVDNVGVGNLIYSITPSAGWLSVVPSGATVGTAGSQNHNITLNTGSLNPGTYEAVLTISGNQTNGARFVTNRLTVTGFFANEIVDQFTNAPASDLNGAGGGTGWTNNWNVPAGFLSVDSDNLPVPNNYPAAVGNKVCGNSTNEILAYRNFNVVSNGTLYAAVAIQKSAGDNAGYIGLSFVEGTIERAYAGKLWNSDQFGVAGGSSSSPGNPGFGIYGSVYFIILKYDFDTGIIQGRAYNSGDTLPLTEPNWRAALTTSVSRINGVRLGARNVGTACFDEIRVARTWENLLNFFEEEPTLHASNMTFENITTNSMTVNWIPGNGAARIVVARAGSPVDWTPTDGNSYAANNDFSAATDLGGGNKIIYNEAGGSVNVTGLDPATRYYFKVFEYNFVSGSEDYLTSGTPLEGNRWTLTAPPTGVPGSFAAFTVSDVAISNTWTTASGASGYVIFRRQGAAVTNVPVNGTAFTDNQTLGDVTVRVVTPGSATTFLHSGLDGCETYHFRIYAFNQAADPQTIHYNLSSGPVANTTTGCGEPTIQAFNIVFQNIGTDFIRLSWTRGSGDRSMVVARQGSSITADPADGLSYTSSATFGSGTQLGTGNYVVYRGTNNVTTVSGLTIGQTYTFKVYSFNGGGSSSDYNISDSTNNPRTTATAAFGVASDRFVWNYFGSYANNNLNGAGTGSGWSGNWSTFGGYGAVDDANSPNTFRGYPQDNRTNCGISCDDSRQLKFVTVAGDAYGATRTFATRNSGKIYAAVKINIQSSFNTSAFAGMSFMNGSSEVAFLGKGWGVSSGLLTLQAGSVATNSALHTNTTWTLVGGDTYLIVMSYDFDEQVLKGRAYAENQLLHTDPDRELAWTTVLTNVNISQITGIRLAGQNVDDLIFDHIRISPSWEQTMWSLPDQWHENFGPVPSLVYIGTNYNPAFYGQVVTNLSDAELRSVGLIDFAVRWDAPSGFGMFLTNNNSSVTNIGSPQGRINPNWDPLAIGAATNEFNLDRFFDYRFGFNGASVVTTYQVSAFNITNINFEEQYFVTVSAEAATAGSGTVAAPNSGNAVPTNRAVTINWPLRFYVYDDDPDPPVRGEGGMNVLVNQSAAGSQSVTIEEDGDEVELRRFFVTDRELATYGMDVIIKAFDEYTGLQRASAGDPSTNVNITIPELVTSNISHFVAARSTPDALTTNEAATNVWSFSSSLFTFDRISDMWGGDGTSFQGQDLPVSAFLADSDDDRVDDQAFIDDVLKGWIRVIDNDSTPPEVGANGLRVLAGNNVISSTSPTVLLAGWNFNDSGNRLGVSHGSGTFINNLPGSINYFAGTTLNAVGSDASGEAFSPGASPNNGSNFQFLINMSHYQSLVMTFATWRAATGYDSVQVAWSTDGTTFTDFGGVINPPTSGTAWSNGEIITRDFSAVTALNNAATVYIRVTINGSSGGATRFENVQFNAQPITYFEVTDRMLAQASATNPVAFSFNVFDEISGLVRGNTENQTNMHITIDGWTTADSANYSASRSTADSTLSTATSVWAFTSFTYNEVGDLFANGLSNRPIRATMTDADFDRVNDNLWVSNRFFGLVRVVDNDTNAPFAPNMNIPGALVNMPFAITTNGSAIQGTVRNISRRGGGDDANNSSNVVHFVTDRELANAAALGLEFRFSARDVHSGISRGTSGTTNDVMSFSVGSVMIGNISDFNSTLSTPQTATNQLLTNVWTFSNFDGNLINQLMGAGTTGRPIRVTIPDTDNDRPNDRSVVYSLRVGHLRVEDNDIRGPTIDSVMIKNAVGVGYSEGFEAAQGWPVFGTITGAWTYVSNNGTNITEGNVHWTALPPIFAGVNRLGFFANSSPLSSFRLPPQEDPGTLSLFAGRFAGDNVTLRLEYFDTDTTSWLSLGDRVVTNINPEYEMLSWGVGIEGIVDLRVVRVDTTGPQVFVDSIVLQPLSEWISTNQLNIMWAEAYDDLSGVDEYRIVVPGINTSVPASTNAGVRRAFGLTNDVFSILGHQGVITGFVFAIDDDNDRPDDRSRGNIKPIVVRVDTNPPVQVANIRATDAIVGNVFDSTIDETEEIKVEWAPGGATEAEAAGWRQSDSSELSPWDSYLVEYYPIDEGSGDSLAGAVTNTLSRMTPGWTNVLHTFAFTNLVISNLDFDTFYRVYIRGRDEAGNVGIPTIVTGSTDRFSVTQGVNRVDLDLEVFWTGQEDRDYDVLHVDTAAGFVNALSNAWQFMLYTNRPAMFDVGGASRVRPGELTSTTYRFYRIARPGRWQITNTVRRASQEIYVTKALPLNPGENWHSLFFVPDTNTIAYVFGTNILDGADNFVDAPKISWYNSTIMAGEVVNVATMQVWLRDDNTWRYLLGGPTLDAPANEVPVPLRQTFNLELPSTADPRSLVLIGQVPTNSFVIGPLAGAVGTTNYHLVSHGLPSRTQLASMNFAHSGLRPNTNSASVMISPFHHPPDEIRILNNTPNGGGFGVGSQISPARRYYMHTNGNFYRWVGGALANTDVIDPSDSLVIIQRNHNGTITWTNRMLYSPPGRNMNP